MLGASPPNPHEGELRSPFETPPVFYFHYSLMLGLRPKPRHGEGASPPPHTPPPFAPSALYLFICSASFFGGRCWLRQDVGASPQTPRRLARRPSAFSPTSYFYFRWCCILWLLINLLPKTQYSFLILCFSRSLNGVAMLRIARLRSSWVLAN